MNFWGTPFTTTFTLNMEVALCSCAVANKTITHIYSCALSMLKFVFRSTDIAVLTVQDTNLNTENSQPCRCAGCGILVDVAAY